MTMQDEIKWFNENRESFREEYPDPRWLVVHGQKLRGAFPGSLMALQFRREQWPDSDVEVLIRRSDHVETVLNIPTVIQPVPIEGIPKWSIPKYRVDDPAS